LGGRFSNLIDESEALFISEGVGALPLADRIAQVCLGGEGHGALLSCNWLIDGFPAIRFLWMRKREARFREKRALLQV